MIRRYSKPKPSRGTVIPQKVRSEVLARDKGCLGPRVGMAGECFGQLELDHVRASHGIGMKSASTTENLVTLCSTHHREKTEHGRGWRPVLIAYLEDIVSDPYTVDRAKRSGGNVASVTPPEGEDGCVLVVPDLAAKVGKP